MGCLLPFPDGTPSGRRGSSHLELSMVDLGCRCGHLVLQICQLGLIGAAVDAAGSILQFVQLAFQSIHGARRKVHLQRKCSLWAQVLELGLVGSLQGTPVIQGSKREPGIALGGKSGNAPIYKRSSHWNGSMEVLPPPHCQPHLPHPANFPARKSNF